MEEQEKKIARLDTIFSLLGFSRFNEETQEEKKINEILDELLKRWVFLPPDLQEEICSLISNDEEQKNTITKFMDLNKSKFVLVVFNGIPCFDFISILEDRGVKIKSSNLKLENEIKQDTEAANNQIKSLFYGDKKTDVLLLNFSPELCEGLKKTDFPFILIYIDPEEKEEFLNYCKKESLPQKTIKEFEEKFDKWVEYCEKLEIQSKFKLPVGAGLNNLL